MPRGWRPKQTEEERLAAIAEETAKIIKKAMVDCDIAYDKDLAALIGVQQKTLSAKFKNGTWTQENLCRIIAVLKIQPENAVRMLGVKL